MRQGNYMKAVATHRKRAQVVKLILELRGYGWITKEVVRPRYPEFAKTSKAWENNAEGLTLALDTLKQHDAELWQDIRDVLGLRG